MNSHPANCRLSYTLNDDATDDEIETYVKNELAADRAIAIWAKSRETALRRLEEIDEPLRAAEHALATARSALAVAEVQFNKALAVAQSPTRALREQDAARANDRYHAAHLAVIDADTSCQSWRRSNNGSIVSLDGVVWLGDIGALALLT